MCVHLYLYIILFQPRHYYDMVQEKSWQYNAMDSPGMQYIDNLTPKYSSASAKRRSTLRSFSVSWNLKQFLVISLHSIVPNYHNIHLNRKKHEYAKKCLRYDLPKVINNTPTAILDKINTHCLKGFATYIKHCIFQSYQEICTIVNCYICNTN